MISAPLPVRSYAEANAELVKAFERWLVMRNYSASTQAPYLGVIRSFAASLGPDSIAAANNRTLRVFLAQESPSPERYQRLRIALRSFYEFLTFAGVVCASPAAPIRCPKLRPRSLPRCLSETEVERLIGCAESLRDRALLELLYASGIRAGELKNLLVRDLNLGSGTLIVKRCKGDKDRLAMVGSKAVEALRSYLGERKSGPVFLNRRDRGPLRGKDGVYRVVAAAAKRAGLTGVHPHTLRHTFATVLLNRGADIRYVQELLGHVRISTTQIYTHSAIVDLAKVHARFHPKGDSPCRK